MKKWVFDLFLIKSIEKFGDVFDFSSTIFVNSKTKIKYVCKPCGCEIIRTPEQHLHNAFGCPNCNKKIKNTEEFIKLSKEIHKDKFNYSLCVLDHFDDTL